MPDDSCGSPSPTRARWPRPPPTCCARPATSSAPTPSSSTLTDADNGVEFFYLRPRDIALYVGEGTLDVGITGRDLLLDSGAKAEEVLPLGFGRSPFRFAAPPGTASGVGDLAGKRIATSYAGVVQRHLEEHGVDATVTRLDGAVETSVQLGVADVIADVVETGSTLRNAGLEVFGEPILESEAVLITRAGGDAAAGLRGVPAPARGRPGRPVLRDDGLRHPRRAGRGGGRAHARASRARRSPRCTGRAGSRCARWCRATTAQRVMDELWDLGARGILSTDIHACRL